jgi:hypothetical protein
MLTIIALTVLGLGQGSALQYLHVSAVYGLEAGPGWSSAWGLDEAAELVVRGIVTGVSSQSINDTIWSRAEVSVDTVEKGTAVTKVVVEYEGGEVGDIELVVSNQPSFRTGEHVLLHLVRGTGDNFRVAGGPAGKILLDSNGKVIVSAGLGYIYTGLHWPSGNVGYYVDAAGGPSGALSAVQAGFEAWNHAGAAFSFAYGGGGNTVRWAYIDGPLQTLAVTYIWSSSYIVYSCETVFDTAESWGTDGSASKFDIQNVAAHEAGHWLVLDDLYESQYSEMTMYGYASRGETKKRTLEWGDIAGIQFIYLGGPANGPPVISGLTPDRASPQVVSTAITWTVTAVDAEGDTLYYKFYVRTTSTGWTVAQDWSASNSWTWTPTSPGTYLLEVWVRDGRHSSSWDAYTHSSEYVIQESVYTLPNTSAHSGLYTLESETSLSMIVPRVHF